MKAKDSLVIRFFMLMIALVALYTSALFIFTYRSLSQGMEHFSENNLRNSRKVLSHMVEKERGDFITEVRVFLERNGTMNTAEIRNFIQSQHLENYIVFDSDENQLYAYTITDFMPQRENIQRVLKGEIRNFLYTDSRGEVVFRVGVPIYNGSTVEQVVFVDRIMFNDEFVKLMAEVSSVEITVFNGYNREYTSLAGMKGTELDRKEFVDITKKGEELYTVYEIGGVDYIAAYIPYYAHDGRYLTAIFFGQPLTAVQKMINDAFRPFIILAIVMTIIVITILAFVARKIILQPLNRINKAIKELSSGDADLTARLPVHGKDETAEISQDVNQFVDMLHQIVIDLNKSNVSLVTIGEELSTTAQEAASSTAEIMSNIESVRKQTENQTAVVTNTTVVIEESRRSMDSLKDLTESQAAAITESSAAIEEMLGNISSVTNSVHKMSSSFKKLGITVSDGNSKMSDVDTKIMQVAEQSKTLMQANAIISQIASQTNLLAMNAAIEAAHAGAAGKGFAVVADEIRKLAETSSVQSKSISDELEKVSNSIEEVVALSRDSQAAFSEIINHVSSTEEIINNIDNAMNEQELASKQIFEALSSMKSSAMAVNDQTQKVNTGIVQFEKEMGTISQVASVLMGSMDEMTAGARNISEASQNCSDLAGRTKDNIGIMESKLNQFRV